MRVTIALVLSAVVALALGAGQAQAQPGPFYSGAPVCYTVTGPQGSYQICPSEMAPVDYAAPPYDVRRIEVLGGRRFGGGFVSPFARPAVYAGYGSGSASGCPRCGGYSYGNYSATSSCPGGCPNCPTVRVFPGTIR